MKYDFGTTTKTKYDFGGAPSEEPFAATKTGVAVNTVLGLPKAGIKVAKAIGKFGKDILTSEIKLAPGPSGHLNLRPEDALLNLVGGGAPGKIGSGMNAGGFFKKLTNFFAKESDPKKISPVLKEMGLAKSVTDETATLLSKAKTESDVKKIVSAVPDTKDFSSMHAEDQKFLSDFSSRVANKQSTTADEVTLAQKILENYGYTAPKTKTALADIISTAEQSATNKVLDKAVQNTPEMNAAAQLKEAIRTAEPMRGGIEAAQAAERGKRFAAASEAQNAVGGQEGYYAGLSKLKGELLEKPPTFTPPSQSMTKEGIDSLFRSVQSHPQLTFTDKLTGQRGLDKLLNGHVPVPSELTVLEDVFGTDVIKAVFDKRPRSQKVWDFVGEVIADVPRALQTTLDMSATLRQGAVLAVKHPIRFSQAFGKSFKGMISNNYFEKALDGLKSTPEYLVAKEMGLHIADPRKLFGHREEFFLSNLAEKIPFIGKPIKIGGKNIGGFVQAGNRAYVGFSNSLRFSVFNDLASSFAKDGVANEKVLRSLADFVNTATGRGTLAGLERHATLMSKVLFAPRYMMSRLQFFNPVWYAKQPGPVRKEALKNFGTFVGTVSTIMTMAKMGGADVETDWRSSNFGKMKVGNSYYDLTAGFGQYVRWFGQMVTHSTKTSAGKIKEMGGKGPYDDSRLDVTARILRGKLAPIWSSIVDLGEGKNVVGEEVTLKSELLESVTPFYLSGLHDAIKDRGPEALFTVGLPSFFGVGVQTYQREKPKIKL